MKRTLVIVVVLVGLVFCQLVDSEPQQRSINSSSSGGNASRNRKMSSRMISSNGRNNRVQPSDNDDEGDSGDSNFDNAPETVGDSSEITFPVDEFFPREKPQENNETEESPVKNSKRWKKIPLPALIKFGAESNVASFFRTYVKNTKVVRDNVTFEEYLANSDGQPILDAKNQKVVVTPGASNEPSLRSHSGSLPFGMKAKGRNSGVILEARAKINVDHAVNPSKSSISLPMCTPEITTVPVPLNSLKVDPSMLVIPKCFRVERCGGCCLSDLTVCEPESKDTVKFPVTVLGYDGDGSEPHPQLQFVNSTTVEVERHTSCKCKCKTKAEHCRGINQKYEETQCSCVCTNTAAYQACVDNPDNRFWDHETCQCVCQEVRECSSGYKFNFNTCDCQPFASSFRSLKRTNN